MGVVLKNLDLVSVFLLIAFHNLNQTRIRRLVAGVLMISDIIRPNGQH